MPRNLSATAIAAATAPETAEVFLLLMTIAHPDLAEPIRVVANTEDIISRGDTFQAYPFEINLPGEDSESVSRITARIDNVDRDIVLAIRQVGTPLDATLEVVLADSPDTVEAGPYDMKLRAATYDALVVEGEVGYEDILNERFPGDTYNPSNHPGLF